MFGNHQIGVLGAHNSGKTIFLTSLLWHLTDHDPREFRLHDDARITGGSVIRHPDHDFNFARHKNTFLQERRWPERTTDFSLATCAYARSGCFFNREVTFVDIPGQRMSDVLMWGAADYAAWARELRQSHDDDPRMAAAMQVYWQLADDPPATAATVPAALATLEIAYKRGLWQLLDLYCPVTPSTYYLGTDGQILGDERNADREATIARRPLWDGGRLLPLPPCWRLRQPRAYAEMEQNFARYREQVLGPLYATVEDCDGFVCCVDVLNLLASGPARYHQAQREFRACIEGLAPSFFRQILSHVGLGAPRLAFVATKADLVDGANKGRMQALLRDFARPLMPEGLEYGQFLCAACVSSELRENAKGERVLTGNNAYRPEELLRLDHALPDAWPGDWRPGDYRFPVLAPRVSQVRPPQQANLDAVFEFVVEGVKP